jgi:hypothetical protein
MQRIPTATISSPVAAWVAIDNSSIDISFLERQYRRRLSTTTKLALTAYYHCNPDLSPCQTVFASRYGEYQRTFGILKDIVSGEGASPAAFSVSVHNTPSGIVGIATGNPAPSTTVAGNAATVEAGFLEAAMQRVEFDNQDIVFIFVDEPLPEIYGRFTSPDDQAYALGLRLSANADRKLHLSWAASAGGQTRSPDGVPTAGLQLARLLDIGHGVHSTTDGRLDWEWRVE